MDEFGRACAGKEVTHKEFAAFVQKKWGIDLDKRSTKWLEAERRGPRFSVKSWHDDQENTVIVYGTGADVEANRHTAEQLQHMVARQWSNIKIPVMSDVDAMKFGGANVKNRHVLLIGGPRSNKLVDQWRTSFPVTFGTGPSKSATNSSPTRAPTSSR